MQDKFISSCVLNTIMLSFSTFSTKVCIAEGLISHPRWFKHFKNRIGQPIAQSTSSELKFIVHCLFSQMEHRSILKSSSSASWKLCMKSPSCIWRNARNIYLSSHPWWIYLLRHSHSIMPSIEKIWCPSSNPIRSIIGDLIIIMNTESNQVTTSHYYKTPIAAKGIC